MRLLCALVIAGALLALAGCREFGLSCRADIYGCFGHIYAVPAATKGPPTETAPPEPTVFFTREPVVTATEEPFQEETPTLTPTISAAEAPTATMVAQLQATVIARIRPTPTAD